MLWVGGLSLLEVEFLDHSVINLWLARNSSHFQEWRPPPMMGRLVTGFYWSSIDMTVKTLVTSRGPIIHLHINPPHQSRIHVMVVGGAQVTVVTTITCWIGRWSLWEVDPHSQLVAVTDRRCHRSEP